MTISKKEDIDRNDNISESGGIRKLDDISKKSADTGFDKINAVSSGKEAVLQKGERIDDLMIGGCKLIQKQDEFCFGMDAVLLSGFAVIKKGETVADLGCGSGILPILLSAKTEGYHFTGIEIQEDVFTLAKRNVCINGLEDKITIVNEDIKHYPGKEKKHFDVVVSNPPYMRKDEGLINPKDNKAISRHEIMCSFRDVTACASRLLYDRGRFYLVHRPHRLTELICTLKDMSLEPKRIRFVYPFADKDATMVLIEASKNGGSFMKAEKPLIIYNKDGSYSEDVKKIYNIGYSY